MPIIIRANTCKLPVGIKIFINISWILYYKTINISFNFIPTGTFYYYFSINQNEAKTKHLNTNHKYEQVLIFLKSDIL